MLSLSLAFLKLNLRLSLGRGSVQQVCAIGGVVNNKQVVKGLHCHGSGAFHLMIRRLGYTIFVRRGQRGRYLNLMRLE